MPSKRLEAIIHKHRVFAWGWILCSLVLKDLGWGERVRNPFDFKTRVVLRRITMGQLPVFMGQLIAFSFGARTRLVWVNLNAMGQLTTGYCR